MMREGSFFTFLSPFDLIQRMFNIYWGRLLLFTQLALIVTIPQIILSATLRMAPLMDDSEMMYEGAQEVSQSMSPQKAIVLQIEILLSYLITICIQAAIIHVVSEIYMHRHPTFKRSLTVAFDRFCAIFCFGLLYSVVFSVFFAVVGISVYLLYLKEVYFLAALIGIAAFAFALYVVLTLTVVLPILVVENQSPTGAIKRSFELVPGYRCYIFCSLFLLTVVALCGSTLYQRLIAAVFGTSILSTIIQGLSSLITVPLQTM